MFHTWACETRCRFGGVSTRFTLAQCDLRCQTAALFTVIHTSAVVRCALCPADVAQVTVAEGLFSRRLLTKFQRAVAARSLATAFTGSLRDSPARAAVPLLSQLAGFGPRAQSHYNVVQM